MTFLLIHRNSVKSVMLQHSSELVQVSLHCLLSDILYLIM